MTIQTNHRTDTLTPSTGGVTVAGSVNATNTFSFENRIINGAMTVNQRNATVTVNDASVNAFSVDRWQGAGENTDGVFTLQQSTVAPSGFVNSMLATVTTADASLGTAQRYFIQQRIEGNNVADFAWGTASAQPITLSFWVRSSVTGSFGGAIRNSDGTRSYPFSYTISSANTWEQKSITIAGDTTGTWLTNNGIGMMVTWGFGVGSSLSGTAGSWASTNYWSVTSATNLMATNGATFYITGVQLEKGTVATSFDWRPYGTELALCQRYFERHNASTNYCNASGLSASSTQTFMSTLYAPKRATPSCTASGTVADFKLQSSGGTYSSNSVPFLSVGSTQSCFLVGNTTGMVVASGSVMFLTGTATLDYSAEL